MWTDCVTSWMISRNLSSVCVLPSCSSVHHELNHESPFESFRENTNNTQKHHAPPSHRVLNHIFSPNMPRLLKRFAGGWIFTLHCFFLFDFFCPARSVCFGRVMIASWQAVPKLWYHSVIHCSQYTHTSTDRGKKRDSRAPLNWWKLFFVHSPLNHLPASPKVEKGASKEAFFLWIWQEAKV